MGPDGYSSSKKTDDICAEVCGQVCCFQFYLWRFCFCFWILVWLSFVGNGYCSILLENWFSFVVVSLNSRWCMYHGCFYFNLFSSLRLGFWKHWILSKFLFFMPKMFLVCRREVPRWHYVSILDKFRFGTKDWFDFYSQCSLFLLSKPWLFFFVFWITGCLGKL